MTTGRRIEIRGTVQGVGFRPFAVRLARRIGIRGRVWNDPRGVTIEAFGPTLALGAFLARLRSDLPRPARVLELRSRTIPSEPVDGFTIEPSGERGDKALSIPPDLATCPDCEAEIFDPQSRRYGYAFTNCTACGPRFTIATDIPYDRKSTSMARFDMCPACLREFEDIENRRFHAQPNACPDCGPTLEFVMSNGEPTPTADPLSSAAARLLDGAIIAVKGLGGFHLVCDATNHASLRTLRERKRRDEKPFAVMVRDLAAARAIAVLCDEEEALLTGPERPIVLVQRREQTHLDPEVAPGTPLLGVFLPYAPVHHLLLAATRCPLVMTSANVSDEPICSENQEALRRLRGIADGFLWHDRDIEMRCDDSVARVIAGTPTLMRRSRGFVPRPIRLAHPVSRPILACGAHLKNTFCIAVDDMAYFGPHIGDLESVAALEFFEEAVERMQRILSVWPDVVAHDLHPGYLSTRYALAREDVTRIGVQHHHAHVVSAMTEHGIEGPVLGVAYDGTGAGEDGTSWGGEFLLCTAGNYERLATFRSIRLPGGNTAMREVWRTAYALLHDAFDGEPPIEALPFFRRFPKTSIRVVSQMIERQINSPDVRGVGRYFDAFGALVLERAQSSHEGQVAMAWEAAADSTVGDAYPYALDRCETPMEVDLRPATRAAVKDIVAGVNPGVISARFHNMLIKLTVEIVELLLEKLGNIPVVLTGGVFQNALVTQGITRRLPSTIELLRHRDVPPGDGGIALGQALIANALLGDDE